MQNYAQQKAENQGYKVEYQVQRFDDNSYLTVCKLLKNDKEVAIGLSICSPRDNYDRKKGNLIACGRALKATERLEYAGSPIARLFREENSAYMFALGVYKAKSIYARAEQ